MPENFDKFGFDASQAFAELQKLKKAFDAYSKTLLANAKASGQFNAEQQQMDDVLKRVSTFAELASGQFRSLADAQRATASEANKLNKVLAARPRVSLDRELDAERQRARLAKETALQEQKNRENRVRNRGARDLLERQIAPSARREASVKEIVDFDRSLDQFERTVSKSRLSLQDVAGVIKNLGGSYTGAAREVRDAAVQVVRANANISKSFLQENQKLFKGTQPGQIPEPTQVNAFPGRQLIAESREQGRQQRENDLRNITRGAKEAATALDKAAESSKNLNISLSSLGKIAFTQLALSGLFRVIGAFTEAVSAAKDYELQLASIQTISQEFAARDLTEISAQVRAISESFGLPLEDVATGLYDTLSNQIGTAAESIQFLNDAAGFARATNISLADSGNLLAGVLKSYGLAASDAADLTGKLFRAIDLGRLTGDELANTLGRVTGLARETGISIDEILASLAAFTIEGIKADEAMTLISNVMLKLIKPTENLKREFQELGVGSVELAIQAQGLQGFLQEITERSGTAAEAVGEFFNQIRGTRGVLGLVGKTADNYAEILAKIQKANEETAKSAEELIRRTAASQLNTQIQELRGLLVDGFGRPVIAAFVQVTNAVGGVQTAFIGLTVAAGGLAVAVGGPAVLTGVQTLTAALNGLAATSLRARVALLGLRAGAVGLGAGALTLGFISAANALVEYRASLAAADKSIKEFSASRREQAVRDLADLRSENNRRLEILDDTIKGTESRLRQLQVAYNQDFKASIDTQDRINSSLQRQLAKRVSTLQSFVSQLQNIQARAGDNVKKFQDTILDLQFEQGQGVFERSVRDLPEAKQADAFVRRSQQILEAAQTAFSQGNEEFAESLIENAQSLANKAADIDFSKQAQVNKVYQARVAIQQQLIAQEQARVRAAEEAEERNAAIADFVAQRVERLAELDLIEEKGNNSLERANEIQQERLRLIGQINTELGKISGQDAIKTVGSVQANLLLNQLKKGFVDPLTGEVGNLTQIADDQFQSLVGKLSQSASQTPIEFTIAFKDITGRDFDPVAGPAQIAQAFARSFAEVRQQLSAVQDLPGLERDIDIANQSLDARIQAFRDAAASRDASPAAVDAAGQFTGLIRQFQLAVGRGDLEQAQQVQTIIQGAAEKLATAVQNLTPGDTTAGAALTTAASNLFRDALKQTTTILESEAKALPLREVATNANAAATTLQGLSESARSTKDSLEAFKAQLFAPTQQRAAGGIMGPDTVSARLTPGEFVMHPRASQMFRPLLTRLNAMALPRFAQGGSVTNVGDVNINISGRAAEKVNARDLAQQFRRELRKGTIR